MNISISFEILMVDIDFCFSDLNTIILYCETSLNPHENLLNTMEMVIFVQLTPSLSDSKKCPKTFSRILILHEKLQRY